MRGVHAHLHPTRRVGRAAQAGLTLVELMVAMVLGLLVAGAAVSALLIARSGFTSVDNGTQMRENVRFAASLMERIGVQAGFYDVSNGDFAPNGAAPALTGCDNALVSLASGAPVCGSANGVNASDVITITYSGSSRLVGGAMQADGTMINCAGQPEPRNPNPALRATSIFHVVMASSGEPTLACTYRDPATAAWATVPLVQGVESLQILYGTDGVTPNAVPPLRTAPGADNDSVADRYITASQINVPGNAAATADNWRRVRSIRIGILVRGAPNTAVDKAATAKTYPVLGTGFSSTADVGSSLTTSADGRLRQSLVFTVHIRNPLDT